MRAASLSVRLALDPANLDAALGKANAEVQL